MINNKLILASAFLVGFAYMVRASAADDGGHSMKKPPKEFIEQCEKEIGITLQDMHNSNEDTEKKQCFHKCIATKDGFLSADGVINIEHVRENFASNPDKLKNVDTVISCLEGVGPISTCQDMTKIRTCFKS